ncbi:MAG TPA: PEGA domain-containing protein [Phycisphaerae bacterium]|nr:PEGA domain-containing protein [Phycisphaerae bacterium]HNU44370.1 PEGA domain-containing protein [Phycisphaerae bacterium]
MLLLALVTVVLPGCVRRTLTITTEPPQALIYLNDQEVGRTKLTTHFLWYGDYDVVIRKEGYQTLHTSLKLDPPWYQLIPVDFFTEVLWPGEIVDARAAHFVLEPWEPPTHEELIERGEQARRDALQIGTQFGAEKPE